MSDRSRFKNLRVRMHSLSQSLLKVSGWRLLFGAILLHVTLALAVFAVGRAGMVPTQVDRDGIMPTFAFDSYEYQRGVISLVEIIRRGELITWVKANQPLHVKLISISSAVIGPLAGYGTLSAEPFNVLCYAAIICLVFALGREIAGRGVGLVAAATVALWPSLLLHSLQLLKDPLFIAVAIALVLCVVTLTTRTYSFRAALLNGIITSSIALLITLIRFNFVVCIAALMLFGLLALVMRKVIERPSLFWNFVSPLPALAIAIAVIVSHQTNSLESFKQYPLESGDQKDQQISSLYVPTAISYLPHGAKDSSSMKPGRSHGSIATSISRMRSKFVTSYPDSGSTLDRDVVFRDWRALISYLPRAFEIGGWAPFPNTWMAAGNRVNSAGKLLSSAEMIFIFGWQLLALISFAYSRRDVAAWLLLVIIAFGFTALGLFVPNVGALYRFRYTFWLLLIVLGAKGLQSLMRAAVRGRENSNAPAGTTRGSMHRRLFRVAPLILLSIWFCSQSFSRSGLVTSETVAAQLSATDDSQSQVLLGNLDFRLVNWTSASIAAVYVSPSESSTWGENLISGSKLSDGDELAVRFSPREQTMLWDIKVRGLNGRYAEWKRLNLSEISQITLSIKVYPENVVMAEIE